MHEFRYKEVPRREIAEAINLMARVKESLDQAEAERVKLKALLDKWLKQPDMHKLIENE